MHDIFDRCKAACFCRLLRSSSSSGVADVTVNADGSLTLPLRPLRRQQQCVQRRREVNNDAHLPSQRQPQQRQHENAERRSSGQRRRHNIAGRKAAAATLLQRAARAYLARAQLAALKAKAAAARDAAARRLQQRLRLRRELVLLKKDARKPLTPQQWSVVEKRRRKSPTLDAPTSPAKRLAAAPAQRRADDGDGSAQQQACLCALPGCAAPRFVEPETGKTHEYCGRSHARAAARDKAARRHA